MALSLKYQPGQTPLDPDEVEALVPGHITKQGQLDEWEQANIQEAVEWLGRSRSTNVLTEAFCRRLHRKMFGNTWAWAGRFRSSDKNIGCHWPEIPHRLRQLLENAEYWHSHEVYAVDEAAMRFHHALVLIHPFPNGNGRHSRIMANEFLRQCSALPFSWGANGDLVRDGEVRQRYLQGLRAADAGDIAPLLAFART